MSSGFLEKMKAMLRPVVKIKETSETPIEVPKPWQSMIDDLDGLVSSVCVSAVTNSVVGRMVLVRVYHPNVHELVQSVYLKTADSRDNRLYAVSLGRYFTGNIPPEEALQRLINGVKESQSLSGRIRHDINTIIEVIRENQ